MAKTAFTDHPEFMRIAKIANQAVVDAATSLDCEAGLSVFEVRTSRIVDDLTNLLVAILARKSKGA